MQVETAAFLLALPPALAAAVWDLKTLTIPNALAAGTAALFLLFAFATLPAEAALWRLAAAVFVLCFGYLLFHFGWVGAGDVKLAAAYAPMIPPVDASVALFLLALIALVLLVLLLLLRLTPLARGSWAVWSDPQVPYAVALSASLLAYLALAAFAVSR